MEYENPQATRSESRKLIDPFYLLIIFLVFVLFSWAARADTYNFYFEPKNKGAKPAAQVQEDETPTPQPEPTAQPPAVSPAPTYSASPSQSQQPVIINNNVSVPNHFSYPPPASAPAAAPAAVAPSEEAPSPSSTAEVSPPSEKSKKWSLTLSAMGSSSSSTSSTSSTLGTVTDEMKQKLSGVLVAAAYRLSAGLEGRLYGGAYEESGLNSSSQGHLIAGLDLDFLPFRFGWGGMNFLELGFILGASTLNAAPGNIASLHAGLRGNLNLSQNWGFTAGIRANLGAATGEIGIVMHL
jgi:hypothetical protein